jgi:hypothetical protein
LRRRRHLCGSSSLRMPVLVGQQDEGSPRSWSSTPTSPSAASAPMPIARTRPPEMSQFVGNSFPSACPRCRSTTVELRSASLIAGVWSVFSCVTCLYSWRSTEPEENTNPDKYPGGISPEARGSRKACGDPCPASYRQWEQPVGHHDQADVKRLQLLALIEDEGPFIHMTALGRQRVERLGSR